MLDNLCHGGCSVPQAMHDQIRAALPHVAYFMRSGPWRALWVRYAYDPRHTVCSAWPSSACCCELWGPLLFHLCSPRPKCTRWCFFALTRGYVGYPCTARCQGALFQTLGRTTSPQFYLEYLAALPPKFRDMARPLSSVEGAAPRRRKPKKGAGSLAQLTIVAKVCAGGREGTGMWDVTMALDAAEPA